LRLWGEFIYKVSHNIFMALWVSYPRSFGFSPCCNPTC
jgi:bacteriorhodopsin